MLASHALALVGVPMRRVIRVVQDQRDARYNLLRGYFHGSDDDTVSELDNDHLHTVVLPLGAKSSGRTLGHFALHVLAVRVVNLRRSNGKTLLPQDDTVLQDSDTLVLCGKPEALARAEQLLFRG